MNENQFYIWFIGVLIGLINILFSLINILFWARIKRIENDVKETQNKSDKIVNNYLSRFEKLHNKMNDVEKNIIQKIYDIKLIAYKNKGA